jgi:hypothetical protein
VYVDDLMFIGKKPQAFFDSLKNEHGFKLKGVEKPSYHLGGDFFRDPDWIPAWGAQSYVDTTMKPCLDLNPRNILLHWPKMTIGA